MVPLPPFSPRSFETPIGFFLVEAVPGVSPKAPIPVTPAIASHPPFLRDYFPLLYRQHRMRVPSSRRSYR